MVKRIIISGSQYKRLFENVTDEVIGNHNNRYEYELDFSGNNDNRQSNDKNFLDWLYDNGTIGKLPPSKMELNEIQNVIEESYDVYLDDFKGEVSEESMLVDGVMMMAHRNGVQPNSFLSEELINLVKEEELNWYNIDLDRFEENIINPEIYHQLEIDYFKYYCDDFDADSLDINDRGLIFIEREIEVPSLTDKFAKSNTEDSDLFNILNHEFNGHIGYCWTYKYNGSGQQEWSNHYQQNTDTLVIRAYVDPKYVDWSTSVLLHAEFPDEYELRLETGTPVEIYEIMVSSRKRLGQKLNLNGQTIIFKA